jgi:hypothetical protein
MPPLLFLPPCHCILQVHLSGYFAPPDTAPGGGEVDSGDDEEYQGDEEDEDSGPESGGDLN